MRETKTHYIEFIKEHPAGIAEGSIKRVTKAFAEQMVKEKFAKKAKEEDFEAYVADLASKQDKAAKAYLNTAEKRNAERDRRMKQKSQKSAARVGAQNQQAENAGKPAKPEKEEYKVIDKLDLENEVFNGTGAQEGDKVLVDASNQTIIVDHDGKPTIKKAEAKKKATSKKK